MATAFAPGDRVRHRDRPAPIDDGTALVVAVDPATGWGTLRGGDGHAYAANLANYVAVQPAPPPDPAADPVLDDPRAVARALTDAAIAHGEDTDGPEMALGDLEILFAAAYARLTPGLRRDFFRDPEVQEVLDCECDAALAAALEAAGLPTPELA
jgi:hypothetical protein